MKPRLDRINTLTIADMRNKFPQRCLSISWFCGCARTAIVTLLIFCMIPLGVPDLYAQDAPPPARSAYTQLDYAQMDQLIAPIALYPDALVAQILAAATYSPQIVEADRFVHRNAGVPPQELAQLANEQAWDPSVKALTAFPSVLSNLDWTTQLGNAYYNQPQDVMGLSRRCASVCMRPEP